MAYTRKPEEDKITHVGWYLDEHGNELLDTSPKLMCSDGTIVKMRTGGKS